MWSVFRDFFAKAKQLEADHGDDDLAGPVEQLQASPLNGATTDETNAIALGTLPPPALVVAPDGWISPGIGNLIKVEHIPTKRIQKLATPRGEPHGIVWHWTATPANSVANAARRIQALPDKAKGERAASFTLGIPQAGALIQLASVEVGTWHAGGATAAKFALVRDIDDDDTDLYIIEPKSSLSANAIMVGVELENVGEVRLVNGQWRSWPFTKDGKPSGHVIKEANVIRHGAKFYERWTEHQIHLATELVRALVIAYPRSITRSSCSWSHAKIDPGRKTDPGPFWMEVILPSILDEVFA